MKKILGLMLLISFALLSNGCLGLTSVISEAAGNEKVGGYAGALSNYIWDSGFAIGNDPQELSIIPLDRTMRALESDPTYKPAIRFLSFYVSEVERHTTASIGMEKSRAAMTVKDNQNLYIHDGTIGFYETLLAFESKLKTTNKRLAELGVKHKSGDQLVLALSTPAQQQLAEAKERCAESHYKVAMRNETKKLRKNRFKAIVDYEAALAYVDNYKDAKARMADVKKQTMVYVYTVSVGAKNPQLKASKELAMAGITAEAPAYVVSLTDKDIDRLKVEKGITTTYDRSNVESCIQMAGDLEIQALALIDSVDASYSAPKVKTEQVALERTQFYNPKQGQWEDMSPVAVDLAVDLLIAAAKQVFKGDQLQAEINRIIKAHKRVAGTGTLSFHTKSTNVNVRGRYRYIQVAETRNGKPKTRKKRFNYQVDDSYIWGTTSGDDYGLAYIDARRRASVGKTPDGPVKSESELYELATLRFGPVFGEKYIQRLKLSFM